MCVSDPPASYCYYDCLFSPNLCCVCTRCAPSGTLSLWRRASYANLGSIRSPFFFFSLSGHYGTHLRSHQPCFFSPFYPSPPPFFFLLKKNEKRKASPRAEPKKRKDEELLSRSRCKGESSMKTGCASGEDARDRRCERRQLNVLRYRIEFRFVMVVNVSIAIRIPRGRK